jgi:hypothetical protein
MMAELLISMKNVVGFKGESSIFLLLIFWYKNIDGIKEQVVLLRLIGNIWYKNWTKRVSLIPINIEINLSNCFIVL